MNWTEIVIAVIGLVGGLLTGGGLMMWFTRKETKEGKDVENMQKVIESMQTSLDAKDRIIEEHEERRQELKADLQKKDEKIEQLLNEKSDIRDENDELKTKLAVTTMLKCVKLNCIDRDPPFGSLVNLLTLKETNLVNLATDGEI